MKNPLFISLIFSFFLLSAPGGISLNYSMPSDPPVLLSPANGAMVDTGTVAFLWTQVQPGDTYEIAISHTGDFTDAQTLTSSDTLFAYKITYNDGSTYWKVRACSEKKICSEWSEVSSFHPITVRSLDYQTIAPCGRVGGCSGCPNPCGRRPALFPN